METLLIDALSALPAVRRLGLRPWYAAMAGGRGYRFVDVISQATPPVQARVNHGRWLADCPGCATGAELVTMEDPILFCLSCGNDYIDGRLAAVVFPDVAKRHIIEETLALRPSPNRNWQPGEDLDSLAAENQKYGMGGA